MKRNKFVMYSPTFLQPTYIPSYNLSTSILIIYLQHTYRPSYNLLTYPPTNCMYDNEVNLGVAYTHHKPIKDIKFSK